MICYPNAKINLGLNVVRKRQDGFHAIESVFYPIPWYDMLEIVPQKAGNGKVEFSSSGIEVPSDGTPNLCEQVYALLHDECGLPSIKMHLHKIIPIGAGLGGGSSDAAFTATMLNRMFELNLSDEKLEQIVAQVGSDCPFFVQNKPAFVSGRGEVLAPFDIDLSGFWIVLVNPKIHIETKEAYSGIVPSQPTTSLVKLLQEDVADWKETVQNDFERSVFAQYPIIAKLKEEMYAQGAIYASMTGSGSTVFGLFEEEPILVDAHDFEMKVAQF